MNFTFNSKINFLNIIYNSWKISNLVTNYASLEKRVAL